MSKKKARNKIRNQGFKISPGPGIFYRQKLCPNCRKLVWGSSPKSRREAERDLGQKMHVHREQHKKEKQLDLTIPGREGEQVQAVRKVTLRGEEK